MNTYKIPDRNLDKLKAKIEKLARKAAKLGTAKIELIILGSEDVEDHDLVQRVYTVTITGETPRLGGWRLVAKLEHLGGGNLMRTLPGEDQLPEQFREIGPNCEYCQTRRDRKDTYVVGHDDGRYQQVGSTCLKDFTGHVNPEAVTQAAEYIWSAIEACEQAEDDLDGYGAGGPSYLKTEGYLAWVMMTIRQHGWMSRSKAQYGNSTTDVAVDSLMGNREPDKPQPTDSDRDLANKALVWAREELAQRANLNDYEWNLVRVSEADTIEFRWIGYVASIMPAYLRENERKQENGTSEYVGEVGKRSEFQGLTVSNIIYREGNYGTTAIHKFVDVAGNCLTWFSSRQSLELGETYSGKATVKKHDEFRGIKQTVLTRCKFEPVATDS